VKLALEPSLFTSLLTLAIAGICYLFIQSVISEADKNIRLQRDKEELKKLDKMKDEFLMVATHELNTPVTVLRGKMSMILDEGFGNFSKDEKEYLKPIFTNIEKLGDMFHEVLEVIKIDQKKMLLSLEQTNMNKLIFEIVKDAKRSEHHFSLDAEMPKEPIFLKIDRPKIKEVLADILDNAIKYSSVNGAAGKIKITLKSEKGETIISVQDNGVGISGEDRGHLAEKFFQSKRFDSFSPMEQQGTGLSLYIAKRIVEMHHGRILIESKEGVGSTFSVLFKNS
jgi:signal transduction histidine kinase